MLATLPTASFTIRGSRPVTIEVNGVFDAGAAVGFQALADSLIGDQHVTIDLGRCSRVDNAARDAIDLVVHRIEGAGGTAAVVCRAI